MKKVKLLLILSMLMFMPIIKVNAESVYKLNLDGVNGSSKQNIYMSYNGNDLNLYNKIDSDTQNYANISNVGVEIPVRKGYAFYGYYANNRNKFVNMNGSFNQQNIIDYITTSDNASKNLTVKAKWEKLIYRVDLIANGRIFRKIYFSNLNDDVIYSSESVKISSIDIPSTNNYDFAGYYVGKVKVIDENGKFVIINNDSGKKAIIKAAMGKNKSIYIKAKWKKKKVKNNSDDDNDSQVEESSSENDLENNEDSLENTEEIPEEESGMEEGDILQDSDSDDDYNYNQDQDDISESSDGYIDDSEIETSNQTDISSGNGGGLKNEYSQNFESSDNNQDDFNESSDSETSELNEKSSSNTSFDEYEDDLAMEYESDDGDVENIESETSSSNYADEENTALEIENVQSNDSAYSDDSEEETGDDNELEESSEVDEETNDQDSVSQNNKYALCYLLKNNLSVGETKTFEYITNGYEGYEYSIKPVDANQKKVSINGFNIKGLKVGTIKVKLIGQKNGKKYKVRNCSILVHSNPMKKSENNLIEADRLSNEMIKNSQNINIKRVQKKNSNKNPKKIVCKSNDLKVGASKKVEYSVSPSSASQKVKIKIANNKSKKIIKINNNKIKAKKVGTATIIISSKTNSKIKKTCKVKVFKKAPKGNPLVPIPKGSPLESKAAEKKKVKSVKIISSTKKVKVGKKLSLKSKIVSNTATKRKIWSSSNTNIATVSSSGKVSGIKKGDATISLKVTDKSGNNKIAKIKIKVTNKSSSTKKSNNKKNSIKKSNSKKNSNKKSNSKKNSNKKSKKK